MAPGTNEEDRNQPPPTNQSNELLQDSEISKVTIKVPPFWKEKPELWFIQVESQFFVARITSDVRKYHTVIAAIESHILSQVSDILLNPPVDNLYSTLKKKIIERFADSDHQRLRKLLQEIDLGDKKPSQLLREMRHLAGTKMDDDLLKNLWLQRLPSNMRAIISVSTEDLAKLTELADKIAEINEVPQLSGISRQENQNQHVQSLHNCNGSNIEGKIAELSRSIAELKTHLYSSHTSARSQSRPRTHHRNRSSSREQTKQECWFHRTFGNNAKKCRPPCTYQSSN